MIEYDDKYGLVRTYHKKVPYKLISKVDNERDDESLFDVEVNSISDVFIFDSRNMQTYDKYLAVFFRDRTKLYLSLFNAIFVDARNKNHLITSFIRNCKRCKIGIITIAGAMHCNNCLDWYHKAGGG